MARRSAKLLRFENSLYKYSADSQKWIIDNVDFNQPTNQVDISEKGTYASCKRMSQKVNPVSLRKGFLNAWDSTGYINYSESDIIKNRFYSEFLIKNYLKSILKNNFSFVDKIEFKEVNDEIFLNVYYYALTNITKRNILIQNKDIRRYKTLFKDLLIKEDEETKFIYNPFFLENSEDNNKLKKFKLDIVKLTNHLEKLLSNLLKKRIKISFCEQNSIGDSATLLASFLSLEIEKSNANFKRALRETFKEIKNKSKIKGIRINCSGRLGKAPMAKTEWFKYGQVPLSRVSSNLEYSSDTAFTKYGSIGVKVWVYYHN